MLAFKLSCFLLLWPSLCSLLKLKSLSSLPCHCNKHMNGWWIAFRILANKMRLLIFLLTGVLRKDFNFFKSLIYISISWVKWKKIFSKRREIHTWNPFGFLKIWFSSVQRCGLTWNSNHPTVCTATVIKNINSLVF